MLISKRNIGQLCVASILVDVLGVVICVWHLSQGHVDDVPLDPTREETYAVLNALFTEMSSIFTDTFFHVGGRLV